MMNNEELFNLRLHIEELILEYDRTISVMKKHRDRFSQHLKDLFTFSWNDLNPFSGEAMSLYGLILYDMFALFVLFTSNESLFSILIGILLFISNGLFLMLVTSHHFFLRGLKKRFKRAVQRRKFGKEMLKEVDHIIAKESADVTEEDVEYFHTSLAKLLDMQRELM